MVDTRLTTLRSSDHNRFGCMDFSIIIVSTAVYAVAIPMLFLHPFSTPITAAIGGAMGVAAVGLAYGGKQICTTCCKKEESIYRTL